MPKRKVSPNGRCPCDSGKKYKHCCITKRFTWLVDEEGRFYRQMEMHPVVAEALRYQEKRFIETFGRKPLPDDPVFFDMPSASEVEEQAVEAMVRAGIRPELIYAYIKTGGLVVTAENQDLIPDKDLAEWDAVIDEFRATKKLKTKGDSRDPFIKALDRLPRQLERAESYLHMIVQEHAVARNIAAPHGEKHHSLHDYVFFCATKSLKTLRAIKRLIPEGFGEDSLALCRSIYENYLTINHVLHYPATINSFVAGKVGLHSGDFSLKKQRVVIVDNATGEVVGEKISAYRMAKSSPHVEDIDIYDFLYRYLSEFTHPDIMGLEAYLDGDRFNASRPFKVHHTTIYGLFSMLLLLDILSALKTLRPRFKQDLVRFIRSATRSLQRVFKHMRSGDGSNTVSQLFIARLRRCGKY
jgi:hypothetical protein